MVGKHYRQKAFFHLLSKTYLVIMDGVLFNASFKNLVKKDSVCIDNTIFRLHYRVTAPLLLIGGVLLSAAQFFGKPISCYLPSMLIFPVNVVETYCWAEGTFTLPKALNKTVGKDVPYLGVDKSAPGEQVTDHSYYQWVCFVLLLQAVLFLIPHYLWSGWEGTEMSNNLLSLDKPVVNKEVRSTGYKYLWWRFFVTSNGVQSHFKKTMLCMAFCFANVVGQMYLMDKFLGGEFTTYGSDVFKFMMEDQEVRVDPMVRVFPRMTKCTFHYFGPSGDVQRVDTVCILPLNILNEKIYVVLWFWFVVLATLTGLDLVLKLTAMFLLPVRYVLTRLNNFQVNGDHLKAILYEMNSEQWFMLHMLGVNMNRLHFSEFVDDMFNQLYSEVAEDGLEPLVPHWKVLEMEKIKNKIPENVDSNPEEDESKEKEEKLQKENEKEEEVPQYDVPQLVYT